MKVTVQSVDLSNSGTEFHTGSPVIKNALFLNSGIIPGVTFHCLSMTLLNQSTNQASQH